ncbi:hypothetical protein GCM10009836_24300 [Pseudonocardia ailaonensis]|uniref:SnoaL-like domain-containing protein n=1 Tax=Pseudonocardia ailaonensis TaxID=367279 RepID=A0ABN2MYX3_9PSEU
MSADLTAVRVATRALADEYAHAVDVHDLDRASELFAPEGALVVAAIRSGVRAEGEWIEIVGPAAVRKALGRTGPGTATMHAVVGSVVREGASPGLYEGSVSATARHVSEEDPTSVETWVMRYADRYVNRDGRWLFTRRQLHRLWVERHPVTDFVPG